jgi:hypothetical protein
MLNIITTLELGHTAMDPSLPEQPEQQHGPPINSRNTYVPLYSPSQELFSLRQHFPP